jgi:methylaspartate mutase epsilon subunit
VQDIAAILSLRELATEYFTAHGFKDADVTTVFHQWMGGFPEDEAQAFGVISFGATAGACAKADKIIVKSPHEAMGIPTKEANAQGLRTTRQVINMLADQYLFSNSISIRKEADLIKTETRSLVNKTIELGKGDIAAGCAAAFQAGVIDVPFAPSIFNAGKVLPARDNEGFVRIFNKGNLALPADIVDYHRRIEFPDGYR